MNKSYDYFTRPDSESLSRKVTLNLKETALLLNTSISKTHDLAQKGILPGAKVGKAWVFLRTEVVKWLLNETRKQQKIRKQTYRKDFESFMDSKIQSISTDASKQKPEKDKSGA